MPCLHPEDPIGPEQNVFDLTGGDSIVSLAEATGRITTGILVYVRPDLVFIRAHLSVSASGGAVFKSTPQASVLTFRCRVATFESPLILLHRNKSDNVTVDLR